MINFDSYTERIKQSRDRSSYREIILEIMALPLGEDDIPNIIGSIRNGNLAEPLSQVLANMGEIATMPLMSVFMDDTIQDWVRMHITLALEQIGDVRIVDKLIDLIIEQDIRRTHRAITILTQTEDNRIDITMKNLLLDDDSSDNIRASAIDLLSRREVTGVIETIHTYIGHETLNNIAVIALYRLDNDFDIELIKPLYGSGDTTILHRLAITNEIRKRQDNRFVPFFIELLEDLLKKDRNKVKEADPEFKIRFGTVDLLKHFKDSRAIGTLMKCMNRQGFASENAISALAKIGTLEAKHVLLNKLGQGFNWFEHHNTIEYLHKTVASFGNEIVPELMGMVKNKIESQQKRIAALDVLCLIGGEDIVYFVLELLSNYEDATLALEYNVLQKLAKIVDSRFFDIMVYHLRNNNISSQHVAPILANAGSTRELISLLDDEKFSMREAAIIASGIKGDFLATKPLINLLSQEDHYYWVVLALEKMNDPDATEALIYKTTDSIWDIGRAFDFAVKVGGNRAYEPLINRLHDKNIKISQEAATALAKLGDKRAIEPIFKLMKKHNDGKFVYTLASLGDERVIPALIERLNLESTDSRDDPVENTAQILGEKYPTQQSVTDALRDRLLMFEANNTKIISVSGQIIAQLSKRGENGIKALVEVLQSENSIIQVKALSAIYHVTDRKRAIEIMLPFLEDTTELKNHGTSIHGKSRNLDRVCDFVAFTMREDNIPRVQEVYNAWLNR